MNKKTIIIILGVVAGVILVASAAFITGRLLNQRLSPAGMLSLGGEGNVVAMSVQISPAPELPVTAPEVSGLFAERKDNTIYIQTFSMDMGSGGGVVMSVSSSSSTGGDTSPNMTVSNPNSGPKVEVVVTNDTLIYADVTPMTMNPGQENVKVQQVVEPGSLDDLTTQTMVTVWGRKVGDRVIADVIAFSKPVTFTTPK